jgi:3-keto-disaccharide hydrolase
MKLTTLLTFFAVCAAWTTLMGAEQSPNTLTSQEKAAGWRLLFDGQTLKGWRNYHQKETGPEWQVNNGAIVLQRDTPAGTPGKVQAGLMTEEQFGDFSLALEWRIAPGGNSGILYRVSESGKAPHDTGIEMQVLDNARHPDARKGQSRQAGACYALYAPAKDATRPVGEWNLAQIVVRTNHVEHWLNGQKLLSYELGDADWQRRVSESKFKDFPGYGRSPKGHLLLQDHSFHVEFRNIKIRPLDSGQ